MPEWRNGRRTRLKIWRPHGHMGSSPFSGTNLNVWRVNLWEETRLLLAWRAAYGWAAGWRTVAPLTRAKRLLARARQKEYRLPRNGAAAALRAARHRYAERCQSGLLGTPGERECSQGHRGFESLPLRQSFGLGFFSTSAHSGGY